MRSTLIFSMVAFLAFTFVYYREGLLHICHYHLNAPEYLDMCVRVCSRGVAVSIGILVLHGAFIYAKILGSLTMIGSLGMREGR